MTKKFEFNWQIPVPEPLLAGCVFDRWTEEKDNTDLELACTFKVDEYGFFIYWKSEGRVRSVDFCILSYIKIEKIIELKMSKTAAHSIKYSQFKIMLCATRFCFKDLYKL